MWCLSPLDKWAGQAVFDQAAATTPLGSPPGGPLLIEPWCRAGLILYRCCDIQELRGLRSRDRQGNGRGRLNWNSINKSSLQLLSARWKSYEQSDLLKSSLTPGWGGVSYQNTCGQRVWTCLISLILKGSKSWSLCFILSCNYSIGKKSHPLLILLYIQVCYLSVYLENIMYSQIALMDQQRWICMQVPRCGFEIKQIQTLSLHFPQRKGFGVRDVDRRPSLLLGWSELTFSWLRGSHLARLHASSLCLLLALIVRLYFHAEPQQVQSKANFLL